ncbi:hypothetical protein AB4865_06205 [Capnocytophaga sp. ARDL2]|uniref:DUF6843 domain-containing protein n=1 Tax=Capnocytophaga sp. ARDL2 TaxID=3238809 RepID=UPI0035570300
MKNILKAIGYIILGILMFWGIMYIFWQMFTTAENEVFILPNDYEGAVIILFDKENGQPEKYDNKGNRLYIVSESGILETKFKFQQGSRKMEYFQKNGKQLKYLLPSDTVWNDTINNQKNDTIYVFKASYSDNFWFLVGKIKNIDSLQKEMDKKWQLYFDLLELDKFKK